jgi:nucleotide-binding universal stress UspA family protein
MSSIVVGVDRSDTARRAAERAAVLAGELGTDLHLVMCAERSKGVSMSVGSDTWQSDWLTDAQQFLSELGRQLPHGTVTTSVGDGDPAKAICEEAERLGAELIVIGNKRVQGLARVLGSVAGDVMKHAHCDVYVANTRDDHDD